MPPCCPPKSKIFRFLEVPRGLQNFIFFCIDFLSILAPSWPPTWGHLGSQDASKFEKWPQNFGTVLPESVSGYEPAFEDRSRASWPRFWGGQGSIFDDFWIIFGTSWLTLGMFSAALAGGASPPQPPPLLTWFSSFLVRSSANLAKKIQELAEDKAENPRTWVHLESQDASKSEKKASNNLCVAPFFWVLIRLCF